MAWRLYVVRRISPRLLGTAVLLLGFWFLTALNTNPLAPATAGRYQYLGIVLMALVASELAAGLRVRRYAVVLIVFAGVAAAVVNGARLHDAAGGLDGIAQQQRGGLAALELARGRVDPRFELTQENSGVDYLGLLDAGSYFSAVDAYGSPAYTPAELATASESARSAADMVSAAALGVRLAPGGQAVPGACLRVDPRAAPTFAVPAAWRVVDGKRTRHPGLSAALRLGVVSRAAGNARAGNAGAAPHPRRPLDETVVRSADWRRGCHRLPGTPSLTAGELLTPRNARILLGLGLAASGALLLAWHSHLTFLIDDWEVLAGAPRVQRARAVRPARGAT